MESGDDEGERVEGGKRRLGVRVRRREGLGREEKCGGKKLK